MKYTLIFLALCCSAFGVRAQVRQYYLNQTLENSAPNTVKKIPEKVEITGSSSPYVRNQLHGFMKEKLHYERMAYIRNAVNDSTWIVTERFKNEHDPEINPKYDFLEFKYIVHKAFNDTIVERVDVLGAEAMLGDFYKRYWGVELNLAESEGKEVISEVVYEHDRIQLMHKPTKSNNSVYSSYSLAIGENKADFANTLSATKVFLIKNKAEQDKFAAHRKSFAYQMKKQDPKYYAELDAGIEQVLRDFLNLETNVTGSMDVIIKADTLGRTWIEVTGKNPKINSSVRESLRSLSYPNCFVNGYRMATADTFHYDYGFLRERVSMTKHPGRTVVHSENTPELEAVARQEAGKIDVKKADVDYNVGLSEVNGVTRGNAVQAYFDERITGGQAVGGFFLGVLGVILLLTSDGEE